MVAYDLKKRVKKPTQKIIKESSNEKINYSTNPLNKRDTSNQPNQRLTEEIENIMRYSQFFSSNEINEKRKQQDKKEEELVARVSKEMDLDIKKLKVVNGNPYNSSYAHNHNFDIKFDTYYRQPKKFEPKVELESKKTVGHLKKNVIQANCNRLVKNEKFFNKNFSTKEDDQKQYVYDDLALRKKLIRDQKTEGVVFEQDEFECGILAPEELTYEEYLLLSNLSNLSKESDGYGTYLDDVNQELENEIPQKVQQE